MPAALILSLTSLQGKLQKHQAFDAEVVANKDRIFSTITIGQGIKINCFFVITCAISLLFLTALLDNNECVGCEAEVSGHIETLEERWAELLDKIAEKGQKLREANQQQQYNEAVKDIDFWLGGLEAQLTSDDCGRDLAAVNNLLKKHHLLEADIAAHEVIEMHYLLT